MKYGYMIKAVDISEDGKFGLGYDNFKYPLRKGAKVIAKDWNAKEECNGGIFGLIHETKEHFIHNNSLWLILKYKKGSEIIVDNSKIKVPYAWIVDWGDAAKMQALYKELTGKDYTYDYAVQTAGDRSTQTAGWGSTQTAGDGSTQTAGYCSKQTAGYCSTQTAGDGSISIIRGKVGYCKHEGEVLQVLCFYDNIINKYIFLTKEINDNFKHKLEAVKINGRWELKDTIIKEEI